MPTAIELVRGTQKVLPTAFERYTDGLNKITSMRVTSFVGTKMRIFSFTIRSSGEYGPPNTLYGVQVGFIGVEDAKAKPSASRSRCICRCTCNAYYFWASFANIKNKAHFGAKFKPYIRKTPISDPRYPPKNPMEIPMMCKHQLLAIASLSRTGQLKS